MHGEYILFGSYDSSDIDIMVFVDRVGSIVESRNQVEEFECMLRQKYDINMLDVNICSVSEGVVTKTYKGTVDEVNNMLYHTYDKHTQVYPNPITRTLPRDIKLKAERVLRGLLSHLSRTEHRKDVKEALISDNVAFKLDVLKNIDLTTITDLKKNNSSIIDFHKFLAFQIGQVIGLLYGLELYTKAGICAEFHIMENLIYRVAKDENSSIAESLKMDFVRRYMEGKYA
jgi:hypothetical protein